MTKYYKERMCDQTIIARDELSVNEYVSLLHDLSLTIIGGRVLYISDDEITIELNNVRYSKYTVDTVKRHREVWAIYDLDTQECVGKIYSEYFK